MVKLVRLTTDDNNAIFKSNLDAGISVSKDASIALQNLTFENEYPTLNIDPSNGEVISNLDTTRSFNSQTFQIPTKSYTKSTYPDFFDDLQGALNQTCSMTIPAVPGNTNGGDVYRSYYVDYPNKTPDSESDQVNIQMRYTPMTTPFTKPNGDTRIDEDIIFQVSQGGTSLSVNSGAATTFNRDDLARKPTDPASGAKDAFIYGKSYQIELSRGCGVFCCRLQNVGNSGSSEANGFGIGLSYTQIKDFPFQSGGGVITDDMRDYELRVKKNNDAYFYIDPSNPNTEVNSGVFPHKFSQATILQNDLLVIEKNNNKITLRVLNSAVPGGQNAFIQEYTIPDADLNKPLYPYLYVCGAETDTIVGMPFITLDPNMDGNVEYDVTGQTQNIGGPTRVNFWNAYLTNFPAVIPQTNDDAFTGPLDYSQAPIISLNNEIWRFLGWNFTGTGQKNFPNLPLPIENYVNSITGINDRKLRIALQATYDFSVVLSDNFVVLLNSNTLTSFDASRTNYGMGSFNPSSIANRGRQLPILATIPVNNNTSGIVQYEPNELVYIDFDFSSAQEIKNLNLQVLNKDLSPININGKAVMTLLIKD